MTGAAGTLAPPGPGRRFRGLRRVQLGDVLPSGRARLDAVARYLQDVASDDSRDAGVDSDLGLAWVVRRTVLEIVRRPEWGEEIELVTWGSAGGARWAERRTTISIGGQPVVEAASVWVCLDVATMRPVRLPPRFWAVYGEAVQDRIVSPRLTHREPPAGVLAAARSWPLRLSDLDVLDHVNNAISWAAVEEEAERVAPGALIARAEVEYREPIDRRRELEIASQVGGPVIQVWLGAEGSVLVSARLTVAA